MKVLLSNSVGEFGFLGFSILTKEEKCSLDIISNFFSYYGFSSMGNGKSITCDFAKEDRLFITTLGESKHVKAITTLSQ